MSFRIPRWNVEPANAQALKEVEKLGKKSTRFATTLKARIEEVQRVGLARFQERRPGKVERYTVDEKSRPAGAIYRLKFTSEKNPRVWLYLYPDTDSRTIYILGCVEKKRQRIDKRTADTMCQRAKRLDEELKDELS